MPPLLDTINKSSVGFHQSSSFAIYDSIEEVSLESNNFAMIMQRLEKSVPVELVCGVRSLFDQATRVVAETQDDTARQPIVKKAVHLSVQSILADVVDQVATLVDLDDNKRSVVTALARASIGRAVQNLDRLEHVVQKSDDNDCLESLLNKLKGMDECTPVRVSMLSRPLALEFMAGQTDTRSFSPKAADELPFDVDLTPYLYVTMGDISNDNNLLENFSSIDVKIDRCTHRKFDAPSQSGFIGEAMVRAYVTPGSEEHMPMQGAVWSRTGDTGRLGIVEVRA